MASFGTILHLIAFMVNGYGLLYDIFIVRVSSGRSYGGPWKFLTFWSEGTPTHKGLSQIHLYIMLQYVAITTPCIDLAHRESEVVSCHKMVVAKVLNLCPGWLRNGTIFLVYAYSLSYNLKYVTERGEGVLEYRGYGGKFKYMTFWCFVLQTLYFGISLLNDLFGSNLKPHDNLKKRSILQRIRDNFVACIVWPVGTFVVITFWGIYAVDRELVFPKALDAIIPAWLNHIMHSTVLLFLLTDKLLVYHHYPSDLLGLSTTLAFGFIYAVWILWVAYAADIWVYPILEVMTWYQRSAFLGGLWLSLSFVYLAGRVVTTLIWGLPRKAIVKKRD